MSIHGDFEPCRARGIEGRYEQLLTNLITNAIQYNKPGGEIRIYAACEGNDVIITVSDTGIGIATADLPHIFERFYRADKARSRAQGNTGLGLAICRAIVEAEQGTIEVSSVPGEGTTFLVRLPACGKPDTV